MGIVLTAVVQTVLAGVGLMVAGVPYPGLLTAVVLVFCIAQLGPFLPLMVGVGWLFLNDFNTAGALLLGWSLFVGVMDNFLRPYLIKKGADLPFLLILSGVIGGLFAFGVVGLFIVPAIRLAEDFNMKKMMSVILLICAVANFANTLPINHFVVEAGRDDS